MKARTKHFLLSCAQVVLALGFIALLVLGMSELRAQQFAPYTSLHVPLPQKAVRVFQSNMRMYVCWPSSTLDDDQFVCQELHGVQYKCIRQPFECDFPGEEVMPEWFNPWRAS